MERYEDYIVLEEIRRDVKDKKGNVHNKLIGKLISTEDELEIALKPNFCSETIRIGLIDIISPYLNENIIELLKDSFNMEYYLKEKAS